MKIKKIILSVLLGIAGFLIIMSVVGFFLVESWRNTPYGKLDFRIAAILKLFNTINPEPYITDNVNDMRKNADKNMNAVKGSIARVREVKDISIPSTPADVMARLYKNSSQEQLPVIVYYHGGGWALGNIDAYDNVCRILCNKAGAIVISIGYRLAPENPFPAAVEDAYNSLLWIAENAAGWGGSPAEIAVCGDSVGANLAAVVSILARNNGKPAIALQALLYPSTDFSGFTTGSYTKFAAGYLLTRQEMEWYRQQYLPDPGDWNEFTASPLLAENLQNLPPALIITARFDVLHDEGEAYKTRLEAAGVPVQYREFTGMIHGFVSMTGVLPEAKEALQMVADAINKSR